MLYCMQLKHFAKSIKIYLYLSFMTAKQEIFCLEYLKDFNATRSYRMAYPNIKNDAVAGSAGERLLKNVEIFKYIEKKRAERAEKLEIDAAWVLKRFKDISDRSMQAVPVMKFDPVEKCMKQVTELNDAGEEVGVYMFDSAGANKATENIGKHIGFYEKDNGQKLPVDGTFKVEIVQPKK